MKKHSAILLVCLAVLMSSCARSFEGSASDLMPTSDEMESRFVLGNDETESPFAGIGVQEISYNARGYSDSETEYHAIAFKTFVYEKPDDAGYMYFIYREILLRNEDTPAVEDTIRGTLQSAELSTLLYSIDESGANDNYVHVWLLFNKNNVVGLILSGGVGAKDNTEGALTLYADEAKKYAEIILSKIP